MLNVIGAPADSISEEHKIQRQKKTQFNQGKTENDLKTKQNQNKKKILYSWV